MVQFSFFSRALTHRLAKLRATVDTQQMVMQTRFALPVIRLASRALTREKSMTNLDVLPVQTQVNTSMQTPRDVWAHAKLGFMNPQSSNALSALIPVKSVLELQVHALTALRMDSFLFLAIRLVSVSVPLGIQVYSKSVFSVNHHVKLVSIQHNSA